VPQPESERTHQSVARPVRLLEVDPELAQALSGERLARAVHEIRARMIVLAPGRWSEPAWTLGVRRGAGLLILEGLMLRRVGFGAELLAAGDLLRPWQREDAAASLPRRAGWRVLERSRVAVLDVGFLMRAAAYPEVTGELLARAPRRSRALAVNMAIVHQPKVEVRLHMLLWHLADRWGTVTAAGVSLPLRLTHAVLADLVAARRPTVSAAVGVLERAGAIERAREGWLLHGAPPAELSAVAPPAAEGS